MASCSRLPCVNASGTFSAAELELCGLQPGTLAVDNDRSPLQSDWSALSRVRRSGGNLSPPVATRLQNCMCLLRIHCAFHRYNLRDPRPIARLRRAALFIVDFNSDVVAYLARKADAKQVTLRVDERDTAPSIWADKSALFILLKNIVENAINASPVHGIVLLTIDGISIEISDEGPGIRKDHLPFLFKRFWRAPDARHDGAGLGLAICKEIAAVHDWRLTVSSLSIGTRFTVWL
ncbi:ATPase/histidine kinase/DNA gyrase B/HSP90 domain protein [Necator americanus]|uniref:histidine kinase n=1 Tax=Necator americanus TaxID=51031 RepID=W2TZY8_NECAM|nr:ATPase/histidine kinase/DNA gyrase B/HSP90 domain protein [Necator americanus]ETN86646.1 ATPase/histidine kinase/DNA gyrase B/HSP90 domain protein [Necator americanus]